MIESCLGASGFPDRTRVLPCGKDPPPTDPAYGRDNQIDVLHRSTDGPRVTGCAPPRA